MLLLNFAWVLFIIGISPSASETVTNVTIKTPEISSLRIIGGSPTNITNYPFAAQIFRYHKDKAHWQLDCEGTLITNRHVLTVAHCYIGVFSSRHVIQVRVGSSYQSEGGLTLNVSKIIKNRGYNDDKLVNDITILRINETLTFGSTIQQASIPPHDYMIPDNTSLRIIGWGRTAKTGNTSEVLRDATVKSVNYHLCAERYAHLQNVSGLTYYLFPTNICTGLLDVGGVDACYGDSGGPVLYDDILIGLLSWVATCANATYPTVDTRVSSYTNWIVDVIDDELRRLN